MPKSSRCFQGILYPDSQSYDCDSVLARLSSVFSEWAYVLHDKDTDENGELKKPHFHWVGRLDSPALITTVAGGKKLCVPENSVEFCESWKGSVKYLTHENAPEKYHYSFDDVTSNFDVRRLSAPKQNEVAKVRLIRNYLSESGCTSAEQLMDWCIENDCWPEYRRSFAIWACVMREMKERFVKEVPQ